MGAAYIEKRELTHGFNPWVRILWIRVLTFTPRIMGPYSQTKQRVIIKHMRSPIYRKRISPNGDNSLCFASIIKPVEYILGFAVRREATAKNDKVLIGRFMKHKPCF